VSDAGWLDVCKWQSFDAQCDADSEVIIIDQATFGRMRLGSCLAQDYGHVGCFSDVRRLMERRCAGRQRCHVQLPDVELDRSPHGCPPDLLAYLEVEYHCQTGRTTTFLIVDREFVTAAKNSRILTNFSKLKKFVKIRSKIR